MDPSEIGKALAARRKPKQFACARCGQEFEALQPAIYCSVKCRQLAWRKKKRKKATPAQPAPAQETHEP